VARLNLETGDATGDQTVCHMRWPATAFASRQALPTLGPLVTRSG